MGLGNGGLGRLAACFLDSIATLDLPAWGYGLRYKYGLFKQAIDPETGQQMEYADDWLEVGNPWEVKRTTAHKIGFYGEIVDGKWVPGANINAVAYDSPIPGYKTKNCISLRLWDAEVAPKEFDLAAFNAGDYEVQKETNLAQQLCAVLYPGDGTREGKALRLSQQYMLCSASVQISSPASRSAATPTGPPSPKKVAIQMNDTHPTLAAPELACASSSTSRAWTGTRRGQAHLQDCGVHQPHRHARGSREVAPRAHGGAPPRHVEIIKRIDEEFIASVKAAYPDATEEDRRRRSSAPCASSRTT